jgi:ABC-2 type transport system permease protein
MIAAILRAQFLSMRPGARGSTIGLVTSIVWYGIWFAAACVLAVLGRQAEPAVLAHALPLAFLAVFLYWQFIPILSASLGSALDMRKLLPYPIPHRQLFFVEILLRLATAGEMLLVLAGAAFGILSNPAVPWRAAPRILAAIVCFIAFNVFLSSGLRSILERLLTRRKVREALAFFLVMIWMLPRLLVQSDVRLTSLGPAAFFVETMALPWTAAAQSAIPFAGRAFAAPALALLAWMVLAAWFGRRQFERSLRFDPIAAQSTGGLPDRPRRRAYLDRFYRFPALLWRDPLAALVEKELRSLARTPRFRMVFVMGFTFGLAVWLPLTLGRSHSLMPRYFVTIVCVYSLTLLGQVTYWNCFGFDRSAALFYFAAPQPIAQVLVAKNIAVLAAIYLEVAILGAIAALLPVPFGLAQFAETLAVMSVCSVYMLAMGNIASVRYARPLNPERVSQGGASARFQGLVFLAYPLALLPVGLAYLARYAFDSEWAFAIVLTMAAAVAAIVYSVALTSAAAQAARLRELLIQDLSRSEGPVIAD